MRRQTAPGRWRKPAKTGRRVRWHPDRAPAVLEAPHRRLGHRSRGRGEGRGLHPGGHAGVDEARPHHEHAGPGPGERVAQALGEAVETRLGRPVDEVGLADPLPRHAGQHDQPTMALATELLGDRQADAHRPRVVDGDHGGRGDRVVVQLDLIDELPERHDDDVQVAMPGDQVGDEGLVAGGVRRLEAHHVNVQPGALEIAHRHLVRVTGGQDDRAGRRRRQRGHDGATDVATAAQQHDGLRFAQRVVHVPPFRSRRAPGTGSAQSSSRRRRRLWSLAHTPAGSTPARTARHSSSRG